MSCVRKTTEFLNWILQNKGGHTEPVKCAVVLREYEESQRIPHKRSEIVRKRVKRLLDNRKDLSRFTLYQIVHLQFLLKIPITEAFTHLLQANGTLKLDIHMHILSFRSNDGSFERSRFSCDWHEVRRESVKSEPDFNGSDFSENPPFLDMAYAPEDDFEEDEEEDKKPNLRDLMEEPPWKKSRNEDLSSHKILTQLRNLIIVLDTPALELIESKIRLELAKPERRFSMIPLEEFLFSAEHCLQVLSRGVVVSYESRIKFWDFLKIFKFFLLTLEVSLDNSLFGEIEKWKNSEKYIPMEKVDFVIAALFQTATPTINTPI